MDAALEKLASLNGIDGGYRDVWGEWRAAPEATLRAILRAMRVDADSPQRSLEAHERASAAERLPHVVVRRTVDLGQGVRIQLPESALARALAWRIVEENGDWREERFDALALGAIEQLRGEEEPVRAFLLPLPTDLHPGYHRLEILENGVMRGATSLVIAPASCYLPAQVATGARLWGCAVQLYGLRSHRNAGIGDFTDLRHACETWAERGAAFIGTNPLHALSLHDPERASQIGRAHV